MESIGHATSLDFCFQSQESEVPCLNQQMGSKEVISHFNGDRDWKVCRKHPGG